MAAVQETVDRVRSIEAEAYKYGFVSDIESDKAPKGLNEDVVRFISAKKGEPQWLLDWRLDAYRRWLTMVPPRWARVEFPEIDFQDLYYYSAPKSSAGPKSLDEVDPELLRTYAKLGIPLVEQEILAGVERTQVAVDAVFDSVSIATTFKAELAKAGVIFCSFSEAVREHGDLVRQYLGSVVPSTDNFYATLNSAVFSDGSFVYVPPGVRCPMELSTYFRINEKNTGQFERTLIIADKGAYVSYLEGCTAPKRDENQLHAAVVELVALDDAEIKYSTVQNWYPGDSEGKGGIYNFVTKRGDCRGPRSKISWTQVETGSAITWKYPSCILRGDSSRGEFYSIAISNGRQQVDSGTKMIHLGKNTTSRIISKGISAGKSQNTYRGQVSAHRRATGARNFTNCDSLLIGGECGAHTVPYVEAKNSSAVFEHEATTSKISDDQLFYCLQRGLSAEEATALIVNGFVRDVLQQLPMEFAVEAQKLIAISLEGSVGWQRDCRRRPYRPPGRRRLFRRRRVSIRTHVGNQKSQRLDKGQGDPRRPEPHGEDRRGGGDHGAERLRQVDAVVRHRRQAGL
jgi:Fe-S cluster assembly protein SufB